MVDALDERRKAFIAQEATTRLDKEKSRQQETIQTAKSTLKNLREEFNAANKDRIAASSSSDRAISSAQSSSESVAKSIANQKQQKIAEMRAAYPAVSHLLTPFTSNGYAQPERRRRRLQRTSQSRPISYSTLLSLGALDDNKPAKKKLFHLVQPKATFGPPNDRPLGDFPEYRNHYDFDNAVNQQQITRAQNFLRKHGEAMVAEGLLSK